jgi:hypothetical protein
VWPFSIVLKMMHYIIRIFFDIFWIHVLNVSILIQLHYQKFMSTSKKLCFYKVMPSIVETSKYLSTISWAFFHGHINRYACKLTRFDFLFYITALYNQKQFELFNICSITWNYKFKQILQAKYYLGLTLLLIDHKILQSFLSILIYK